MNAISGVSVLTPISQGLPDAAREQATATQNTAVVAPTQDAERGAATNTDLPGGDTERGDTSAYSSARGSVPTDADAQSVVQAQFDGRSDRQDRPEPSREQTAQTVEALKQDIKTVQPAVNDNPGTASNERAATADGAPV